jgi:hypothetical protein
LTASEPVWWAQQGGYSNARLFGHWVLFTG